MKVIGTKPWAEAHKFIEVTAGKKYRLRYNADLGNCAYLHIIVANPADGSYVWIPSTGGITAGGNYSGNFTAEADLLEIRFQMPALPAGESTGYFHLDDIYLEEVVEVEDGGSVNGGGYRYQFNGKEDDKEIEGQQDYGFRIYDKRLGRFKSVDPITKKYPELRPYQFASNRPIDGIDLDGLEFYKKGKALYNLVKFKYSDSYTWNEILARNRKIHSIVLGVQQIHKRNDAALPNPEYPDQDNHGIGWNEKPKKVGAAVESLVEFSKWLQEEYYDVKYDNQIDYAVESIVALHKAAEIVLTANVYLPVGKESEVSLKNNSRFLKDVTNYITDLTLPENTNKEYLGLVRAWGKVIYNNKESINNGTFNFSRFSLKYKKEYGTDGYIISEFQYYSGNHDPELMEAYKKYDNIKRDGIPKEQSTINQN